MTNKLDNIICISLTILILSSIPFVVSSIMFFSSINDDSYYTKMMNAKNYKKIDALVYNVSENYYKCTELVNCVCSYTHGLPNCYDQISNFTSGRCTDVRMTCGEYPSIYAIDYGTCTLVCGTCSIPTVDFEYMLNGMKYFSLSIKCNVNNNKCVDEYFEKYKVNTYHTFYTDDNKIVEDIFSCSNSCLALMIIFIISVSLFGISVITFYCIFIFYKSPCDILVDNII